MVRTFDYKKAIAKLPDSPGVYLMRGKGNHILYVGKAGNLKRRVSSYFLRPQEYRIEKLVSEILRIDHEKTDTAIEALILESRLIKKFKPPFNVRDKDDKSFLYVEITGDKFPRVLLARGKDVRNGKSSYFGPFTSAKSIREAMKILRKIFPYSIHPEDKITMDPPRFLEAANEAGRLPQGGVSAATKIEADSRQRGCFDSQIGLCPGTCVGAIARKDYLKTVRNLKLFFEGGKQKVLKNLKKDMRAAAHALEFEKAEKIKNQIFALQHINDIALITDPDSQLSDVSGPAKGEARQRRQLSRSRIEGYDISNISGTSAVGSMVVFVGGVPDKNEYRRFKIRTLTEPDDVGMLREVLRRRFAREDWPVPNLILIDGGVGQVNAAKNVLAEYGLKIPVTGIAKGPERKKTDFIGTIPENFSRGTLINVRDEAHRFAISYHRKLRGEEFLGR